MSFSGILTLSALHIYSQPVRPNVVVILTDDMGYAGLQAFGHSEIPTPNIDRLCREGMEFTNFHATAPICVASWMGLLTGRYQERPWHLPGPDGRGFDEYVGIKSNLFF